MYHLCDSRANVVFGVVVFCCFVLEVGSNYVVIWASIKLTILHGFVQRRLQTRTTMPCIAIKIPGEV